jgi:hypothetical protein
MLINEIKTRGFLKFKVQIEEKESTKKALEISVENLQKKLNFVNSQKKHFGVNNTKFEAEIKQFKLFSERSKRDIFFMQKEIPNLNVEIPEVYILINLLDERGH